MPTAEPEIPAVTFVEAATARMRLDSRAIGAIGYARLRLGDGVAITVTLRPDGGVQWPAGVEIPEVTRIWLEPEIRANWLDAVGAAWVAQWGDPGTEMVAGAAV